MHQHHFRLVSGLIFTLLLGACGGSHNKMLSCAEDDECPAGHSCRNAQCVAEEPAVTDDAKDDAGEKLDAEAELDAAEAEIDAALEVDAAIELDAAIEPDAGTELDTGMQSDAELDASPAADAGEDGAASDSMVPVPSFVIRARTQGVEAIVTVRSDAPSAQCSQSMCQVNAGASVRLEAPELEKYRFSGFGAAAACTSSERTLTIASIEADLECVATYVPRQDVSGKASGVSPAPAIVASSSDDFASCSGDTCRVDRGGTVRLVAPTVSGYRLKAWSGAGCDASAGAAQNLSGVAADTVCTAEYVRGVGVSGSVLGASATIVASSNSPGANCSGARCGIDVGGSVTLEVAQPVGYVFNGWSGDDGCTGSTPRITLSDVGDSKSCSASFALRTFPIRVLSVPAIGGTLRKPCDGSSDCTINAGYGTQVDLEAVPADGWVFNGWSGCSNSVDLIARTPPVTGAQNCSANFVHSVVGTVNPPEVGVTSCPESAPCIVSNGGSIALQPPRVRDYVLTGWEGCPSGAPASDGSLRLMGIRTNLRCTANFQRITYSVSTNIQPTPGARFGTASCSSSPCTVNSGDSITLTATPINIGSAFAGWSGCATSTTPTITLSTVRANQACTATFRTARADLTVDQITPGVLAAGSATGTVTFSLTVRVTNIGDVAVAGNVVRLAVHNGAASVQAPLASFTVPGQANAQFPILTSQLNPGASVTLTGTVTMATGGSSQPIVAARIDSCAADPTLPDPPCRVQELNEDNNFSRAANVPVP